MRHRNDDDRYNEDHDGNLPKQDHDDDDHNHGGGNGNTASDNDGTKIRPAQRHSKPLYPRGSPINF